MKRYYQGFIERFKGLIGKGYLGYRKYRNQTLLNYSYKNLGLSKSKIFQQVQKLKYNIDQLTEYIDGDYVFLDIPDYRNIGDHMIYQGSIDFLKTLPYSQNYAASKNNCNFSKISERDIILLQGGGNFGDTWPKHQEFRELVIQSFPKNKIIIFPQTIFFHEEEKLNQTSKIFNNHPNLIICARDYRSFQIAQKNFGGSNILLVPDMAYYMDLKLQKSSPSKHGKKRVLYMQRKDKELITSQKTPPINNMEVRDWPTYDYTYYNYLPNNSEQLSFYINEGIIFMSKYDFVITTRLHGSILANLLGIPTILLDNSYGKNRTFYYTWMESMPNYHFCADDEVMKNFLDIHLK